MARARRHKPGFGSVEAIAALIKAAGHRSGILTVTLVDCPVDRAREVFDAGRARIASTGNPRRNAMRAYELPDSKAFDVDTKVGRLQVRVTVTVTDRNWRAST
jgi:hypothetical protein